eukprot:364660-Chlamydomonas_euryale.AAC.3
MHTSRRFPARRLAAQESDSAGDCSLRQLGAAKSGSSPLPGSFFPGMGWAGGAALGGGGGRIKPLVARKGEHLLQYRVVHLDLRQVPCRAEAGVVVTDDNLFDDANVGAHHLELVDRAALEVVGARLEAGRADERLLRAGKRACCCMASVWTVWIALRG